MTPSKTSTLLIDRDLHESRLPKSREASPNLAAFLERKGPYILEKRDAIRHMDTW